MIEFKTAVLVGAAMKMGAIVAGSSEEDAESIYRFGRDLGIAFQLQDDYLDAFGDPKTFGKQVGGDIIENKKTFLYLKAMEFAATQEKEELLKLFTTETEETSKKVEVVKNIFRNCGAVESTKAAIREYTDKAFLSLEEISVSESSKNLLKQFGEQLMHRSI